MSGFWDSHARINKTWKLSHWIVDWGSQSPTWPLVDVGGTDQNVVVIEDGEFADEVTIDET